MYRYMHHSIYILCIQYNYTRFIISLKSGALCCLSYWKHTRLDKSKHRRSNNRLVFKAASLSRTPKSISECRRIKKYAIHRTSISQQKVAYLPDTHIRCMFLFMRKPATPHQPISALEACLRASAR